MDGTARVRNYIGAVAVIADGPQGYLSELPIPGAVIAPHFHDVDQFQVFVGGGGRIGASAVRPVSFQYADAFTPYGPIVADATGISFFTLRVCSSSGHFPMPECRGMLPQKPGRNIAGALALDKPLPAAGLQEADALLVGEEDGLRATGLRLGPHARLEPLDCASSGGGGLYVLVCSGALRDGQTRLPELSLVVVERGESMRPLTSGPDGARLLLLQFARPTDRPGSDPEKLKGRDPKSHRTGPRAQ